MQVVLCGTTDAITEIHSNDGSLKYRFLLERGLSSEAAYFFVPGRDIPHIACVSTQLGCAAACQFCSTTASGFFRNLTPEEIVLQVDTALTNAIERGATDAEAEVSFMGMGEPLANLTNLLTAIERIHERYPRMRRVAVSTVGPARRIVAFTEAIEKHAIPVHLQVSLHATSDELRRQLIPNAPDSIANLINAARQYHLRTTDRVCLNYILLDGVNDSLEDASWFDGLDRDAFWVRLTVLNDVWNMPRHLRASSGQVFRDFSERLTELRIPHKIFRGDGLDVMASCGQLAARPAEVDLRDLKKI